MFVSAWQMQEMKTSILRVQEWAMKNIFTRTTRDVHDIREEEKIKHWIECRDSNSIEENTEDNCAWREIF